MQTLSAMIMVVCVLALVFRYRPRWGESLGICSVCLIMAVISPVVPAHTWLMVLISLGTKGLALLCCLLQLSRERRHRNADQAALKRALERREHPTIAA